MRSPGRALVVVGWLVGCGSGAAGKTDDSGPAAAPALTIEPATPTTTDDLVARVDGGGSWTYAWTRDGAAVDTAEATASSRLTTKGESWSVVARSAEGEALAASVTIGNAPPTCASATLGGVEGGPSNAFVCACEGYSDPDGDAADAPLCDFIDEGGQVLQRADACTWVVGIAVAGSTLTCSLVPNDGEDTGAPVTAGPVDVLSLPKAAWMSGGFGVGLRIPAGDSEEAASYDVDAFVDQIQDIDGVEWVVLNLSNGAFGDRYLAPHSVLTELNPGSTPPERDLFGEIADALEEKDVRIIAYMATQGPAMLKHGAEKAYDYDGEGSPAMDRWAGYVRDRYGSDDEATLQRAYAEVIVAEYASRYERRVDGWWFDHAGFGDVPLLHQTVSAYNTSAVVAFNDGQKVPLVNNHPGIEDYTFGHPTPVATTPASSEVNLPMVTSVEDSDGGYLTAEGEDSLGHLFMPMAEKWNGGEIVWTVDQAADWQGRVQAAGGAWTWNLPRDDLEPSLLEREKVDFLLEVLAARDAR